MFRWLSTFGTHVCRCKNDSNLIGGFVIGIDGKPHCNRCGGIRCCAVQTPRGDGMSETHWKQIRTMGTMLENTQDTAYLIEFIRRLSVKGLLTRDMFHAIAEAGSRSYKRWEVLHELASERGRDE